MTWRLATRFYGRCCGLRAGAPARDLWMIWNLRGPQWSRICRACRAACRESVDGHDVPVPHFGLLLMVPEFHALPSRSVPLTPAFNHRTLPALRRTAGTSRDDVHSPPGRQRASKYQSHSKRRRLRDLGLRGIDDAHSSAQAAHTGLNPSATHGRRSSPGWRTRRPQVESVALSPRRPVGYPSWLGATPTGPVRRRSRNGSTRPPQCGGRWWTGPDILLITEAGTRSRISCT